MQPTSLQIKQRRLRAKIVLTGKHHPLAAPRAFSVQLGKQARRHVLTVQQGSFEKEEVGVVRLVLRAQQECTRRRKVKEIVFPVCLASTRALIESTAASVPLKRTKMKPLSLVVNLVEKDANQM